MEWEIGDKPKKPNRLPLRQSRRKAGAAASCEAAELSPAVEITGALRLLLSLPSLTLP